MRRYFNVTIGSALCVIGAILAILFQIATADAETLLRRGNHDEPDAIDPQKSDGLEPSWVQEDMFIGLTRYNPRGQIVPDLAEKWEVSADGLTWTFHLRPNLTWSDGRNLTAQDFVWSFQRAVNPKTGSPSATLLYPVENAEVIFAGRERDVGKLGVAAPDPRTFVIHLRVPTAYLLGLLTLNVTYPVPRQAVEKYGEDWTRPGHIVCSGAFKLAEWVPQDRITLVRNPAYYDANAVKIDAVQWQVVPDDETALRSFRNGELDIARVPVKQVPWARKFMPDTLHTATNLWTSSLFANNDRSPFNDVRVRQALSMAIDRDTIVAKVTPHGQLPAVGLVPPGMENYVSQPPDWAALPYDQRVIKARELLALAGFDATKRLKISVLSPMREDRRQELLAMGAMLKPIGIDLVPQLVETQIALGAVHAHDFDVAYYGWIADYPDPWSFLSNYRSNGGALNEPNYRNPAYDALLDAAEKTIDAGARLKLLEQAEALLSRDQAVIPIQYNNTPMMVSAKLQGYVDNPIDRHRSSDMSFSP